MLMYETGRDEVVLALCHCAPESVSMPSMTMCCLLPPCIPVPLLLLLLCTSAVPLWWALAPRFETVQLRVHCPTISLLALQIAHAVLVKGHAFWIGAYYYYCASIAAESSERLIHIENGITDCTFHHSLPCRALSGRLLSLPDCSLLRSCISP